jgi:hypothetical protein
MCLTLRFVMLLCVRQNGRNLCRMYCQWLPSHLIAKNAGKFKDYVHKNKQTFDVALCYNGCSGAPHYATAVVEMRHIILQ